MMIIGNEAVSNAAPSATAANPMAPVAAPATRQRTPATAGSLRAKCTVSVMKFIQPESLAL